MGKKGKYFSFTGFSDVFVSLAIVVVFIAFLFSLPRINRYIALHSTWNSEHIIEYLEKKEPRRAALFSLEAAKKFPGEPYFQYLAGALNYDYGDKKKGRALLDKSLSMFYQDYSRLPGLLSDHVRETMAKGFIKFGEIRFKESGLGKSLLYFSYAHDSCPEKEKEILETMKTFIGKNDISDDEKVRLAYFYYNIGEFSKAISILNSLEKPARNLHLLRAKIDAILGRSKSVDHFIQEELELFPDNLAAIIFQKKEGKVSLDEYIKSKDFTPLYRKENLKRTEHVTPYNGDFYFYRSDAILDFKLTTYDELTTTCYIVARGTPAGNIWPVMQITLNEKNTFLFYVNNKTWSAYPMELTLKKGVNEFSVRFLNRGVYGAKYDPENDKTRYEQVRSLGFSNIWHP